MSGLKTGIEWLVGLALVYAGVSFAWSAMALLIPYRLPVTPEYQPTFLLTEVAGHVVFGVVAGMCFGKFRLAVLCGFLAAAIDSDHLLSITISPVLDRSAHSILFALLAATVLSLAATRGRRLEPGVFLVTIASVLTHLSFDTFLSNGAFPLFFPLSDEILVFAQADWLAFEAAAVAIGLTWGAWAVLRSRRAAAAASAASSNLGTSP